MINLLKTYKRTKDLRNDYKVKPKVKFCIDDSSYIFSFLPTVVWQPATHRYLNCCVIDIWWLYFHIAIGEWVMVKKS